MRLIDALGRCRVASSQREDDMEEERLKQAEARAEESARFEALAAECGKQVMSPLHSL